MNFANLSGLFWFGLAVPIVVLYILKIRLRRVPVSTILFWRQIFEEKKPKSIWQTLRHLLSLLLQLAFLCLLVLALADPIFAWQSRETRRLVLVVDNSASMNATDVLPSRLASVKEQGLAMIDGLRFLDEMAVISAGTQPQVHSGMTNHQRTLRAALRDVPATDGPTRVKEAVELARRLLADHKNRKIILLTDGGFDGAAETAKADDVEVISVGAKKSGNVGITSFQVRRSLLDPIGYEILAEVSNHSDEAVECRFELNLDDNVIDVVPIKLEPNGRWTQVFEKASAEGGRINAKINRPDALLADNSAWAVLPRRQTQRTVLTTEGNLFLEKALEAIPLVNLSVVKDFSAATPAATLKVFHRRVPETLPPGPVLVVEPANSTDLWELGETLQNPIVTKQDKDSPLMGNVRLDNVLMPEARQLKLKGKAQVLVAAVSGDPLYAVLDRPEGKVLVLTVNLDKSDLPLQTAFPIMVTNALAWFSGTKGELRESVSSGSLTDLDFPASGPNQTPSTSASELVLKSPDGRTRTIPAGKDKTTIGPLDQCGVWTVERRTSTTSSSPKAEMEVACNLANRRESDLRPPNEFPTRQAVRASGIGGRPIWYYLLAVAWLLAGTEWFLYQRRWID